VVSSGEPWGLPVFCIGEFLRVVTSPRYVDPPVRPHDAIANIDALVESPGCQVLTPGVRYWSLLKASIDEGRVTGNRVFDAQIVAVCLEHGVDTILTEDRDFRRFDSITVRTLDA